MKKILNIIILFTLCFALSCKTENKNSLSEKYYIENAKEIITQNLEEFTFLGPGDFFTSNEFPEVLRRKLFINDTLKHSLYNDFATIDKIGNKIYLLNDTICNDLITLMRKDTNTSEIKLLNFDTLTKFKTIRLTHERLNIANNEFPKTHKGEVSFSKFYFNKNHNRCLVYVDFMCGGLCGSGNLYYLIKEASKWKIKKKYTDWIS